MLRRRRQIADRHVLDHAAAKRADFSQRKASCLKGEAAKNPRSSETGGNYCDRPFNCLASGLVQSLESQPLSVLVLYMRLLRQVVCRRHRD